MESTLSASDVALLNHGSGYGWGNNSWGNNGIGFLFAIILLSAIGGNGFGWGNRGNAVTESDLCNANSFQELKGSVRNVSDQIANMNVGLTKGLCDFGYSTLAQFNQLEKQLSECCCTTQRAIDGVKFDMANYFAATNQAITAGVQSVKDMFRNYQEQNLRDENMRNYIQSQLCGIVRYPTATTYATDCNPFFARRSECCGY